MKNVMIEKEIRNYIAYLRNARNTVTEQDQYNEYSKLIDLYEEALKEVAV